MNTAILVFGLMALLCTATAYNILAIMAFGSRSCKNALDPIAEELGKRGHQVTIISNINDVRKVRGVTNVYLSKTAEVMGNVNFFEARTNQASFFKKILNVLYDTCNATYQETVIQNLIKNPTGYDAMIIDAGFNDFILPLAHHMKTPVIYVTASQLMHQVAWNLNIPQPYSYLPMKGAYYTSTMSFPERAATAIGNILFIALRNQLIMPWLDGFINKNVLPNSPPIVELENNVSFVLSNSHPAVNHVMPSMPYFVEVGCLHCTTSKALPKELEDFFNSSGHYGIIYFSLGSVTKGADMPLDMRAKLIKAFSRLPQNIFWKYETPIENLPKNIRLTQWASQQDILGHPKTRLFITHGGGLSTIEAAYHGCPILCFPLSADQHGNAANAVDLGFAEYLDWGTFTDKELLNKLHNILANKRYKKRATELSTLLRDQPQPPVERATYWVEYVIRHKGAPHLKSGAEQLHLFQYFLIDVISGAVLAIVLLALLLFSVVRWLNCKMVLLFSMALLVGISALYCIFIF